MVQLTQEKFSFNPNGNKIRKGLDHLKKPGHKLPDVRTVSVVDER